MGRARIALVCMGVLMLASPLALGKPPKTPPAPPPPPAAVEPKVPTEEEFSAALADFTRNIASGNKEAALDALVAVLNDPEKAPFHGAAYASMGTVLSNMDYPYAAMLAMGKGIQADATRNGKSVKPVLELGEKLSDSAYLEQVFAKNVGLDVDAATRSKLAYLAARGSYYDGNYSTALGILSLVGKDSPDYGAAMRLKGVIQARLGKNTEALTSLLAAEQLAGTDQEAQDIIALNLARVYYASENYARSIEYYAKVSRGSPWWPEAQFERAWAHFRLEDMNGTLGILQTHSTPFYADWYFPEAEMLRIYALFLLCKFPEASKQIDTFQTRWIPVRDDLQATLAGMDAAAVFAQAAAFANGEETKIDPMVLRGLGDEDRFTDAIAAVAAADKEIKGLSTRQGAWAELSLQLVKERREQIISAEGGRIKKGIEAKIEQLTTMLNDTELTKLDMLKLETRLYEQAAVKGEIAETERKARREIRVRKGFVSWPYEGEVWADEIGYYRVNAIPECPEGLMTGSGPK